MHGFPASVSGRHLPKKPSTAASKTQAMCIGVLCFFLSQISLAATSCMKLASWNGEKGACNLPFRLATDSSMAPCPILWHWHSNEVSGQDMWTCMEDLSLECLLPCCAVFVDWCQWFRLFLPFSVLTITSFPMQWSLYVLSSFKFCRTNLLVFSGLNNWG